MFKKLNQISPKNINCLKSDRLSRFKFKLKNWTKNKQPGDCVSVLHHVIEFKISFLQSITNSIYLNKKYFG